MDTPLEQLQGLLAGQELSPAQPVALSHLIQQLDLPVEVRTREAAAILSCSKHTILRYLDDGLLEWRNLAPPSSARPEYRITLRSVLQLRLGYQTGSRPVADPPRRKSGHRRSDSSGVRLQHLRRPDATS
jgi:hypothetical protein